MKESPWRTPAQRTARKLGTDELLKLYERLRSEAAAATDPSRPRLVGDGPVEFSTALGLDITPRFVWDSNGFYRRLGVPTNASRREIARAGVAAMLACTTKEEERRVDAIVRTLIDPARRRSYDATPMGAFFAFDPYLLDQRLLAGLPDLVPVYGWPWAYYIVQCNDDALIEQDMGSWRTHIANALHGVIEPNKFALGIAPGEAISIDLIGHRIVIFVGVALKPSWDYAHAIAAELRRIVADPNATASTENT